MNKNNDILEELMPIWQQHSAHIDQIVQRHEPSFTEPPQRFVLSSVRRQSIISLATALVCTGFIAAIIMLRKYFCADLYDQLFFLLFVLALALAAAIQFRRAYSLRHPGNAKASFRLLREGFVHDTFPQVSIASSIAVMILFLVVPIPEGRAMSYCTHAQQQETLSEVSYLINNL